MTKVACYIRISTSKQEHSIENQCYRLEEYCKTKGWDYDIYTEVESSRRTRPIKQELLKRLRNHEYEAVVFCKLCRWARSSTELLLEIDELLKKGISVISLSDNLDFGTAVGQLHFAIISAFTQFERNLISERTRSALQAKRDKYPDAVWGRPRGSKDKVRRDTTRYKLAALQRKLNQQITGNIVQSPPLNK